MAGIRFRSLNRDGTDNIDRSQLRKNWADTYHLMLSAKWSHFLMYTIIVYMAINCVFGFMYFLIGPDGLQGHDAKSHGGFLVECLFFSVQTFSTIGYGRVSPVGIWPNLLVSIEAFTGMMSIAVMSGILFARFSRPTAKIHFSEVALLTNYMGKRSLLFRLANGRLNQVAEAEVSVMLLKSIVTPEGVSMRRQFDLKLVRATSQFFAASWLVVHEIDDQSPLMGMTLEQMQDLNVEIFVSVQGFDEAFSQTIHSRYSYVAEEIVWDRQFADMVNRVNSKLSVDLSQISVLK